MDTIARSPLDCNRNKREKKKLKQRIEETEPFTNKSSEKRLME